MRAAPVPFDVVKAYRDLADQEPGSVLLIRRDDGYWAFYDHARTIGRAINRAQAPIDGVPRFRINPERIDVDSVRLADHQLARFAIAVAERVDGEWVVTRRFPPRPYRPFNPPGSTGTEEEA